VPGAVTLTYGSRRRPQPLTRRPDHGPTRAASCYGATGCQADNSTWPRPTRPWGRSRETPIEAKEGATPGSFG